MLVVLLLVAGVFACGITGCGVALFMWTAQAREMSKTITGDPPGTPPAASPETSGGELGEADDDDVAINHDPPSDPPPTNLPPPVSDPPPARMPPKPAERGDHGSGGRVTCSAMGSFRACGFANVCTNQTASGVGTGASEPEARAQAINFCNGSIRARGGTGMCSVTSCSRN
jgi:hypothetical protein